MMGGAKNQCVPHFDKGMDSTQHGERKVQLVTN
jgi:hypothetical protein